MSTEKVRTSIYTQSRLTGPLETRHRMPTSSSSRASRSRCLAIRSFPIWTVCVCPYQASVGRLCAARFSQPKTGIEGREGGRGIREERFDFSPLPLFPASPSHWRAGGREGRSHGSLVIFPHRSHRETGKRTRGGCETASANFTPWRTTSL